MTAPEETSSRRWWIVVPNLNKGGAQDVAVTLANELARSGVELTLVVLTVGRDEAKRDIREDVKLVRFEASRVRQSIVPLTLELRRADPETCLGVMDHANTALILAKLLARSAAGTVLSYHSDLTQAAADSRSPIQKLRPVIARIVSRYAGSVVAVSSGVARSLVACGVPSQIVTRVPNPVLSELVEVDFTRARNESRDGGTVLWAGRMVPEKDPLGAVEVLSLLGEPWRLIMLGDGPLRPAAVDRARELRVDGRLALPGWVNDIDAYIDLADCALATSRREGMPGFLIEAAARGLPAVSTDCPSGPFEVLDGGRLGTLTAIGDYGAMAEGVVRETQNRNRAELASDPHWREFLMTNVANRYSELLEACASRGR